MRNYRYKIQVGGEYTYRKTGPELDDLIYSLTSNATIAELLAQTGITPPPPKEEEWHKA